ncbi:CPBP family intramembrane glutamic endopeptidase [Candidatus Enterovibrio escicola]|uniref:CPBP family intramembrane glutamic endopeptidase n=1 Tax=Candidatus Enterovibrio escicola TaxID=1927127 RepID=UPI0012381CC2|nr:CPBP family intramembrane glutamic endopeptidase [Candidatus Enterovibrio escacola]
MEVIGIYFVWILLAFGIIAAFSKQKRMSISMAVIGLLIAFVNDRLSAVALLSVLVGFGVAHHTSKQKPPLCYVGYSFLFLWSLSLWFHLIPGFNNVRVLDNVFSGPQSIPFNMYLDLDKPMIFFALLLSYPDLLSKIHKQNLQAIVATTIPLFALLPIASTFGKLELEFSIPNWWWLFLIKNLLFTCVVEEAFFRGFLQRSLSQRFGLVFGLLIASTLFGLAHLSGGLLLVVFASLAGLGYGLIFHFSGRLWAAVLVHFFFNFSHLIFFTYPLSPG